MKKLLFNLRALMLLLLMMVGVSSVWAEDATMAAGTNGSTATVNSKSAIKVGTSKAGGDMTITVPPGATSLEFYAAAWNGVTGLSLNITPAANVSPTSASLTADTGIANNSPFTLSGTESSYKFTIALSNITAETTLTLTSSTTKRFVVWGATYTTGGGTPATPCTVTFNAGSNGTCSTTSLTETSAGAGVTLPSCIANTGYRFEGWSTSNTPASADAGVAGATYKPSSDCTLYAYYVPVYTAQFSINGLINAGNNCTVANGEAITFPSDPVDINGKKFVGWTKTQNYSNATTAPSDLCKSANMGNEGVTYYAVFATVDGNGGSACYKNVTDLTPGKTYVFGAVKVAASPTLANDRAIAAVNFTSTSSWGSYTTITPNSSGEIATSNVTSDNLKWVLESITGGAYTFKSGNNYLSLSTSTGASTAGVSTTSACVYLEDASSTCAAAFLIHPSSNSSNKLLCNTGTNYGYRMYGSSTNATASMCPYVRFYEYDSGVSYSDYCTSVVTLSTPTVTFEENALPASFYAPGGSGEAAVAGDTYTRTATASNEGNITYTSSNTNIAIVDPATGEVIAVAPGNVTITATTPAVDGFSNQASASYDITVSARPVVEAISFSPAAGVVEKGATITISCVTEGAAILYSVDGSDPTIEYTEPIAINSSCTIKAKATKDTYVPAVGSATYTVVKSAQTVTFETSAYSFRLNSDEYNSFNNSVPQTATSTYGSANITYSSNNPSVVDVNSTSGAITLKGETGKATITATAAETDDYNSASASYTITVLRAGVTRTGDFRMVTNVSDLKDGDYVLLTSKKSGDYVSAFKGSATSFQSLTVTNDEISKDNLNEAVVLTVGKETIGDKEYFTFVYDGDSEVYLAADDNTNAAGSVKSETSVSDYSLWNLTIASWGTVVAKVKAKSEYCVLSFNGNNLKTYKNALQKDSLYIYKQLDYNLQAQTLEFATPSYMFPLNEAEYNNWSHQEVTGAETTVTYTSSNTDVADVNNEGKIVLKGGVGATTITASATEENGYNRASATYTITVTQALWTVSFVVNGTPNAIKETESNGGITIPVNPTAVGEYAFLGWGSAELVETLDRPDFKESFKPGDLHKPTNNETYYAIFGREANGNGTFYLKDENNYASAPSDNPAATFSNTTDKSNAAVFGYTNEGKVYYMDGESRRYFSSVSSETGANGRVLSFNDVEASAIAWNIIEANGKIQFQSTGGNNKYLVHNGKMWAAYASGTGTNTFIKEYLAPYYFTTAPTTLSTPTIAFANPTDVTIAIDEVSNNVATSSSSAPVTYTSSNPEVASVDNEGNVKGLAVGTTIITAQVAAVPEISLQASVSYKVTVERITTEIAFKDAESNTITTADVYADNEYTFTAQTNSDATIVYSLSATTYATINGATGVITFKPATGETWKSDKQVTVYAKVDQTDRYTAASSYSLAAKITISIKDNRLTQTIAFPDGSDKNFVKGDAVETFRIAATDAVTNVTYASSNTDIAEVDENTGEVTVHTNVGGPATITATAAGAKVWNEELGIYNTYNESKATYTITVDNMARPVISVASGNYDAAQTVKLTAADAFAVVYTLDGSNPSYVVKTEEYNGEMEDPGFELTINQNCTLKVIAINNNLDAVSAMAQATYTFNFPAAATTAWETDADIHMTGENYVLTAPEGATISYQIGENEKVVTEEQVVNISFENYGKYNLTVDVVKNGLTTTSTVENLVVYGFADVPFTYDGGKTDMPYCFVGNNLGSDYDYSPKFKFSQDGTSSLTLLVNYGASLLTYDYQFNGTWSDDNTFKCEISADGVEYFEVAKYDNFLTSGELQSDRINLIIGEGEFAQQATYIRWTYTKSSGNFGLGNIKVLPAGPMLSHTDGSYVGAQVVEVFDKDASLFYYTIDGSVPTNSNYENLVECVNGKGLIEVRNDCTLRVASAYDDDSYSADSKVALTLSAPTEPTDQNLYFEFGAKQFFVDETMYISAYNGQKVLGANSAVTYTVENKGDIRVEVNSTTGAVNIISGAATGTATITATAATDGFWNSASASYTITVGKCPAPVLEIADNEFETETSYMWGQFGTLTVGRGQYIAYTIGFKGEVIKWDSEGNAIATVQNVNHLNKPMYGDIYPEKDLLWLIENAEEMYVRAVTVVPFERTDDQGVKHAEMRAVSDEVKFSIKLRAAIENVLASKAELQGWKTFYNARTSFEVDENTSIYIAQVESNEVLLTKVDGRIVVARTPVLLKTTDDVSYQIHVTETADASEVDWSKNAFGVTSDSNNTGYVLAAKKPAGSDKKVLAFWKYTNLPAGMVYIPVASEAASLRISIVEEESTGIRTIEEDKNTQEILFNLTGLKVTENKGLVVREGKVVLVK